MVQKCSILPEEYISNLFKCYQKCLTFQSHTIWFSLTVASHTPWGGGPSFHLEKRILNWDPSLDRKLNVPFARLFEKGESNSSNLSKCSTVNHSSAFAPKPKLSNCVSKDAGRAPRRVSTRCVRPGTCGDSTQRHLSGRRLQDKPGVHAKTQTQPRANHSARSTRGLTAWPPSCFKNTEQPEKH